MERILGRQPLADLLNKSFRRNRFSVAVHYENKECTYKELSCLIINIGQHILKSVVPAVEPSIIGIMCKDQFNSVVTILACLSRRLPYLVIDNKLPNERIQFMLENSNIRNILTDQLKLEGAENVAIHYIQAGKEGPQNKETDEVFKTGFATDLAYTIYTSGSTGKPKGINHAWAEIEGNIQWISEEYPMDNSHNVLQLIPFFSDPSLRQLLWPLTAGASLTLLPTGSANEINLWVELMRRTKTTELFIVPSLLRSFLQYVSSNADNCKDIVLRRVFTVGEPLFQKTFEKFHQLFPAVCCYNQYGVSEISGNLTSHLCKLQKGQKLMPIGNILKHIEYYVIDEQSNHLQNLGDIGTLAIRVEGMQGSYVGNVESERFEKMYTISGKEETFFLTGDQVRIGEGGELTFISRLDSQVKILGQRIELMEIECLLASHPGIVNCAVVLNKTRANPIILAYYESEIEMDTQKLKGFLANQLPSYMIPAKIKWLESIPKLANGKIDRVSLQNRESQELTDIVDCSDTGSYTECTVLGMFRRIFKNPGVTLGSNFIELGGNSLTAFHISQLLSIELNVRLSPSLLYQFPTPAELSEKIDKMEKTELSTEHQILKNVKPNAPFPLQQIQLAYVIGQAEKNSVQIHDYLELKCSKLDADLLNRSINKVIERHEMLRCILVNDGYQQVLAKAPAYNIQKYEIENSQEIDHLETLRSEMSHQHFNLTEFPCFDIRLTQTASFDCIHLSISGVFIDAKGLEILLRDWSYFYENIDALASPLGFSFRDYTEEIKKSKPENSVDKAYWMGKVRDFPPGPELPYMPSSIVKFCRQVASIPHNSFGEIKTIALEIGVSVNSFLITCFCETIARFSSCREFVLNLTLNNLVPIHKDLENIIGNFTSTMLFAYEGVNPNTNFEERVKQMHAKLAEDLDHRSFTGLDVQRLIFSESGTSAKILFPVVFTNLLQIDRDFTKLFKYQETTYHITQTPQVTLDCKVYEDRRGFVIEWDHLEDAFPYDFIGEMHALFVQTLLMAAQTKLECGHVLLKGDTEFFQMANKIDRNWEFRCLHELFLAQCEKIGTALAIVATERKITYTELRSGVLQLAKCLADSGVGKNDLVGVYLEKGWEQVLSVLAILCAGAAYVPIDPNWPNNRVNEIIQMAGIRTVLCMGGNHNLCGQVKVVSVEGYPKLGHEELIPEKALVDSIAYVIFTSGTTGKPKGVSITHKGAVNTILDMNTRCDISYLDKVLCLSELHFDLSVYDIFGPLAAGGCLVIPHSADKRNPEKWVQLLTSEKVKVWNSVPGLLQMLTDYLTLSSYKEDLPLRWVWLSGDRIPVTLPNEIRKYAKSTEILSLGGATEASIWSICYPIIETNEAFKSIPYGKGMVNQRVYVLDSYLNNCPIWVQGEIYIAGMGLADGYLGDEEKTRESFFEHPETTERLYKTGDFGRYLPCGNIEFLGRKDAQVKLNGYRIELEEIRAVMQKHEGVKDSFVCLFNSQIGAFVKPKFEDVAQSYNELSGIFKFKKSQPGLHKVIEGTADISLPYIQQELKTYASRKSYRTFLSQEVTANELTTTVNALSDSFSSTHEMSGLDILTLDIIGKLLHPLSQLKNANLDLPKYTYASAGNLYPVQVYLKITSGAVRGLEAGYYYYDPTIHQLQFLYPQKEVGSIELILVGNYSALEPIYKDLSEHLMWLNAGYLLSVLPDSVDGGSINWVDFKLQNQDSIQGLLLDEKELLRLSLHQSGKHFSDLFPVPEIRICLKNPGSKKASKWLKMNDKSKFEEPKDQPKINITGDGLITFQESSVGVFFASGDSNFSLDRIACGFYSHRLMLESVKQGIGFCPIGNLDFVTFSSATNIHALFGGKVSEEQISSIAASSVNFALREAEDISQSVLDLITGHLPDYMVPQAIHVVNEWPLTANGKVDLNTLQKIWESSSKREEIRRFQNDNFKETFLSLVKDVLKTMELNINSNFFQMGGNSISAVKFLGLVRSKFGMELGIDEVLRNPNIHKLFTVLQNKIVSSQGINLEGIKRTLNTKDLPLALGQERLYFLNELYHGSEYNIPVVISLKGEISIEALIHAFQKLVERHEVLRSRFYLNEEGLPRQEFVDNFQVNIIQKHFQTKQDVNDFISQEIQKNFDLSELPLFRIALIRQGKTSYLSFIHHHIISDGTSIGIMAGEISYFYNNYGKKITTELAKLPIQFKDYVLWQNNTVKPEVLSYWQNELSGYEILQLPNQKPRPNIFNHNGSQVEFILNPQLTQKLKKFAYSCETTLYTVLMSTVFTVLSAFSGQNDICIGSPGSNRFSPELESLVGFFVDTVVHRINCDVDNESFKELVHKVSTKVIQSFSKICPFEMIVESVELDRDSSRSPLFQVMVALQNIQSNFDLKFDSIVCEEIEFPIIKTKFDLTFLFKENETTGEIRCVLEYYEDIFEAAFVKELACAFISHVEKLVKEPDQSIYSAAIAQTPEFTLSQSNEWNPPHAEATIVSLFKQQVLSNPEKVALTNSAKTLTYLELDQISECIALNINLTMLKNPSIECNILAILGSDKLNSICLMLGVLKSSRIYTVVDTELPQERIDYILADTGCKLVLLDSEGMNINSNENIICLNFSQLTKSLPVQTLCEPKNGICAVIYTSGTTGVPKGVLVTQTSVIRLVVNTNHMTFHPEDNVAQICQLSFDASNWEIYGALLSGASLVVVGKESILDRDLFQTQIIENNVTVMSMPIALFKAKILVSPNVFCILRVLVLGGEEPSVEGVSKLFFNPEGFPETVLNVYGPTENGTITTTQIITKETLDLGYIPIGKPISGTFCYILDKHGNSVRPYVVAELYIGGIGLAKGYLNKPQETEKQFVVVENQILYKSGDFVSYLPCGSIRFHKRNDHQVKIRGYRIEQSEIENVLLKIDSVTNAVVSYSAVNESLTAFLVLNTEMSVDEIISKAESLVPHYMIPQNFIIVDKIPLTFNGKVDMKTLNQMHPVTSIVNENEMSEKELLISGIFCQLLNIEEADINQSFFRMGGNSLVAIALLYKINELLGTGISMKEFYSKPTVKHLASCTQRNKMHCKTVVFQPDLGSRFEPFPLLDMQQAYLIGRDLTSDQGKFSAHCYFEFQFNSLDIQKLEDSLNNLIKRHDMLRCVLTNDGNQVILESVPAFHIPVETLDSDVKYLEMVMSKRERMSHQIINLKEFPTFDIRLTRHSSEDMVHLSFDGLFMDGLSLNVFLEEWSSLYSNQSLPIVEPRFRDFVTYTQRSKQGTAYAKAKKYYLSRVAEFPSGPDLPKSVSKSVTKTSKFLNKTSKISSENWSLIKQTAGRENLSPTIIVLAAYTEVLFKYSNSKHFAINMTLFNRRPIHQQINSVIGEFTNILLLEVEQEQNQTNLLSTAHNLQKQLFQDLDHNSYSTLDFQREIAKNRGGNLEGAFPIVFTSLLSLPRMKRKEMFESRFLETNFYITQTPQVLIDCKVYEDDGNMFLEWDYRDGVYPDGMISEMFNFHTNLITQMAEGNFKTSRSTMTQEIAFDKLRSNKCLHELFLESAVLNGNNAAVCSSDKSISYTELEVMSGNVARELLELHVKSEELVAVVLDKGWQQVVAVLGILRAGCAYVPINVDWPEKRINEILKICNVRFVISNSEVASVGNYCTWLDIESILENNTAGKLDFPLVTYEQIAYVIFTSGTTGVPKGVTIQHYAAVNTILDMTKRCGISKEDVILGLSELHFDLSVFDIFGILAAGGCLLLPDAKDKKDPQAWTKLMLDFKVSVWNSVPALLQMLTDYLASKNDSFKCPSLRWVWLSGDRISLQLPESIRKYSSPEILSLGGATEASIWSICYTIKQILPEMASIPYGKAMENQEMYVLDRHLELCPTWVRGELFIGGVGLAVGYWNDRERTEAAFFKHPVTNELLYRTGDFGRFLPDGNIEFLGREDDQVKINGYRIELEEIKCVLSKCEFVADALVTAINTQRILKLAAFVILKSRKLTEISEQIRTFLTDNLPKYMIPSKLLEVSSWPLTPNGKIDKCKLEELYLGSGVSLYSEDLRATPFSPIESRLLSLWQDVLKCVVPLTTEFFKCGGNSLDALKLALLINESFHVNVNVAWIYKHQSITEQAKKLELEMTEKPTRNDYIIFNKIGNNSKTPIILIHPGRDSAFAYSQLARELGEDQPIIALEYHNLFADSDLDSTVEEMASRYIKVLVTIDVVSPPYILGGWSFGGLVAFEMSVQLRKSNRNVKTVLMFDTPYPNNSAEIADMNVDVLSFINEPEKQLYYTLNSKSKERYCKAALTELKANQSYKVPEFCEGGLEIVQFLPTESSENNYLSWNDFGKLKIIPVAGNHGSILRNNEHRATLVTQIKKYMEPKLVILLVGKYFEGRLSKNLFRNHKMIAVIHEYGFSNFNSDYGNWFSQIHKVETGGMKGYLTQLDFNQCHTLLEKELVGRNKDNTFIISLDEGNVLLAAELKKSFGIDTGSGSETVSQFRNKTLMKKVLKIGGVNVPKFIKLDNLKTQDLCALYPRIATVIGSPFVLKPVDSGGSYGVYKIESEEEFHAAVAELNEALEYEAEEFLNGGLYHCDIALQSELQNPVFAECALYFDSFMGCKSKHNCVGSSTCTDEQVSKEIIAFCTAASKILGGISGMFHCEVFRNPETGLLTFLEVGCRVPGALIPKMYEMTHNVNLHDLNILLQMNESYPFVRLDRKQFGIWSLYFSYKSGKVITVSEIEGKGDIVSYYKKGEYYDTEKSMYNVVGTVVLADTHCQKITDLRKQLSALVFVKLE